MIAFDAIERRLAPDSAIAPLLRAMFVRNEWMLRPMLEMLDEESLSDYLGEVEQIWRCLHAIRLPMTMNLVLKDPAYEVAAVCRPRATGNHEA